MYLIQLRLFKISIITLFNNWSNLQSIENYNNCIDISQ